jgi:hypothetical protein
MATHLLNERPLDDPIHASTMTAEGTDGEAVQVIERRYNLKSDKETGDLLDGTNSLPARETPAWERNANLGDVVAVEVQDNKHPDDPTKTVEKLAIKPRDFTILKPGDKESAKNNLDLNEIREQRRKELIAQQFVNERKQLDTYMAQRANLEIEAESAKELHDS